MPHDETPALHFTQNDGRNDIRTYQPLAVHLSWALAQKSFGLRSPSCGLVCSFLLVSITGLLRTLACTPKNDLKTY
jgi:hypothetical protein